MEPSRKDDVRAFARTFAPDGNRPAYRPSRSSHLQWLGVGLVLVVAGLVVAATAWFAYQRAIPESMLRRGATETFAAARERNSRDAPFAALSAIPLLLAGAWLLAKRPPNDSVRLIGAGAAAAFFFSGMLISILR